jgi:Arc/MetJ family transcription regulator
MQLDAKKEYSNKMMKKEVSEEFMRKIADQDEAYIK